MSTAERVLIPGQRPPGRYEREKSRSFGIVGWVSNRMRRVPMVDWITLLLLAIANGRARTDGVSHLCLQTRPPSETSS